jgi:DHA1 family tetracycline resistance protein-like MFS transporter
LSVNNRRAFDWKKANPLGAFKFLRKTPAVSGLALGYFLMYMAAQAVQANWSFFTMYRFQWTPGLVGLSLAVVGVLVGGVQVGLTRVVNPKLGDAKSIYVGFGLYTIGLLLFAFATSTWMMFAILVPYCLGGVAGPALQSTLAGHVAANEQGELQGSLTGLMSLTTVLGPLLMNDLFTYFTSAKAPVQFPGISFALGAVFMLVSLIIVWSVLSRDKRLSVQGIR